MNIPAIKIGATKVSVAVLFVLMVAAVIVINNNSSFSGLIGGTVLTLNQIDYGTDPTGSFDKIYQANVVMNGGGQYISGTQITSSAPTTLSDTDGTSQSKTPITVNFKLDKSSCSYQLGQAPNTISLQRMYQYFPNPTNSVWANTEFGLVCKSNHVIGDVYTNKLIATEQVSGSVYCSAFSEQVCANDFQIACANKAASTGMNYKTVDCSNTVKGFLNLGNQVEIGKACVLVTKADPNNADYLLYSPNAPSHQFAATVTVKKGTGESESLSINSVDQTTAASADVQARFTQFGVSSNTQCKGESSFVIAKSTRDGWGALSPQNDVAPLTSQLQNLNTLVSANPSLSSLVTALTDYNGNVINLQNKFDRDTFNLAAAPSSAVQDMSASPATYPNIMLYIRASWLGVVEPTATPTISGVTPNPVPATTGVPTTVSFSVDNIGSGTAPISVGLPVCDKSVSTQWVSNPNRNYAPNSPYLAVVSLTTGFDGSATCSVKATATSFTSNPPTTTQTFTINSAPACTNVCEYPAYRKALAGNACNCQCDITEAYCAQSGLAKDPNKCGCMAKPPPPQCGTSGQPPCPPTACSDGTVVGLCSQFTDGKLCAIDGNLIDSPACVKQCTEANQFKDSSGKCTTCAPPKVWNSTSFACNESGNGGSSNIPIEYIIVGVLALAAIGYYGYNQGWF